MEPEASPSRSDSAAQLAEDVVACRLCAKQVVLLIDFDQQPLCNRLLIRPTDEEQSYPLRLGQCVGCGLLQLLDPVSAAELKPDKPLRYTEPESHLDQVADLIGKLPGLQPDSQICGITTKDQSTVDRLVARGFHSARCLRADEDLGINDPCAGIETVQQQIGDGVLQSRAAHRRRYRVVIARHVVEHAHQPNRFIEGLRSLLTPDGFLVIEVPDFTTSLLAGDYSTLWEEHVVYFTSATLSYALELSGLGVRHLQIHPYVPENSLVVVASTRPSDDKCQQPIPELQSAELTQELALGRQYSIRLPDIRRRWRDLLAQERIRGRQVALLGAGHLGIMFLNVMDLKDVVDVVVDDDPEKCGRYLPGSHHLVSGTSAIYERPIELCLLSISPEGEDRVFHRQREFIQRGGRFRSIFPGSPWACLHGSPENSELPERKD